MPRFRGRARAATRTVVRTMRAAPRRFARRSAAFARRFRRRASSARRTFTVPVVSLFAALYVLTAVLARKMPGWSGQTPVQAIADTWGPAGEGKRAETLLRGLQVLADALRESIWTIVGAGALVAGVRYMRRSLRISTAVRLGPVRIDPLG